MKICHITTVHKRDDVRVFYKQCVFIAQLGHTVTLFVADGKGDELLNDVQIVDIGNYRTQRLKRFFKAQKILKQHLSNTEADIYQLHDPELIGVGNWLKKRGKHVVFDSHEDVPKQILYKSWLGPFILRKFIANCYNWYEKKSVRKFDGLISVIDEITRKFNHLNSATIKNFPILSKMAPLYTSIEERKEQVVYLGSLTKVRGVLDYIKAMEFVPISYKLILIGSFESKEFEEECKQCSTWNRVEYLGFLPIDQALKIVALSKIALSVLHPEKNYLSSLPTKGFEYMTLGVPTIISNFDYWRPYFNDCMIMVKPENVKLIAEQINLLIKDKNLYFDLKEKSLEKSQIYSWESEVRKLVDVYEKILN